MTPEFNAFGELAKFVGTLSVLSVATSWWRKDSPEQDKIVSESCDILIEGVLDADKTNKIDLHTGRNIREQLSIEQLEDMDKERQLRRFERRN